MIKIKKNQNGFTILEMLVALGLTMVIMAILSPFLGRMISFNANIKTETNLQVLGMAVEEWYDQNAWEIDTNQGSEIPLPNSNKMKNNTTTLTNNGWNQLALKYTSSQNSIYDGNNHAFRIFVSNRLEQPYQGILIPYHIIAIVSGNGKGVDNKGGSIIESTFNASTGELNLADTESAYVVSGYDIQKTNFDLSKIKLENVSKAYEDYYWSRYSSQGREPAINYFGRNGNSSRWDMDSNIEAICSNSSDTLPGGRRALGSDIGRSGLVEEFQLPEYSVKSEWGKSFRLLNCGSTSNVLVNGNSTTFSARTPESGNGRNIPPYTATLGFSLPNSETFTTTITSKF